MMEEHDDGWKVSRPRVEDAKAMISDAVVNWALVVAIIVAPMFVGVILDPTKSVVQQYLSGALVVWLVVLAVALPLVLWDWFKKLTHKQPATGDDDPLERRSKPPESGA